MVPKQSAPQHDIGPPNMLMRAVAIPRGRLQAPTVDTLESDETSGSHESIQTEIASRVRKRRAQFSNTKEEIRVLWNDQSAWWAFLAYGSVLAIMETRSHHGWLGCRKRTGVRCVDAGGYLSWHFLCSSSPFGFLVR
jgi:hypothetical protein